MRATWRNLQRAHPEKARSGVGTRLQRKTAELGVGGIRATPKNLGCREKAEPFGDSQLQADWENLGLKEAGQDPECKSGGSR